MTEVTLERREAIGIIWVDNPPVNAISQAVRSGIIACLDEGEADAAIEALVLAARGRTFMAGADISEFGKPPKSPSLPEVIDRLDATGKPLVAAIHGTALGGGLELALACHYRVADRRARVGQPEVNLGLIPGAGGTQRLPRLAGVETALEMIVIGKPMPAVAAHEAGIIDQIVEDDVTDGAVAFAEQVVAEGAKLRRTRDIGLDEADLPDTIFDDFRQKIARKTRGFFAPEKNIQAVEAAVRMPFDEGVKRERDLFMECMNNPQSGALRHAFFAERKASRIPDLPKDTAIREIKRVGIIGAGTMGGGIAMNFANIGLPVTIVEAKEDALERGLQTIEKNYHATARKGRISEDQVKERMDLLTGSLDVSDLADCDLIIEAVFENMDVKKDVFSKLDAIAKDGAILATNTSYLDINEIAAATDRPADVLGLHFFSPANVMRLLEIVRARETAPDVLATAVKMAKRVGKVGVVAGVCHGFIGNRMLQGYLREAGHLILEGASPSEVDRAIHEFGFPMGPFQMGDLAGLDIGYMQRQSQKLSEEERLPFRVHDRLVEQGRKGQKTGAGFYVYEEGSRAPVADPAVDELIAQEAQTAGIQRRAIPADEIVERCVLPLINEGAKIIDAGIAMRASDIDVVYLYGYGFPRWRGGPMYYGDSLGLGHVRDRVRHYNEQIGSASWDPAPLLETLANSGKSFADWDKENTS